MFLILNLLIVIHFWRKAFTIKIIMISRLESNFDADNFFTLLAGFNE